MKKLVSLDVHSSALKDLILNKCSSVTTSEAEKIALTVGDEFRVENFISAKTVGTGPSKTVIVEFLDYKERVRTTRYFKSIEAAKELYKAVIQEFADKKDFETIVSIFRNVGLENLLPKEWNYYTEFYKAKPTKAQKSLELKLILEKTSVETLALELVKTERFRFLGKGFLTIKNFGAGAVVGEV